MASDGRWRDWLVVSTLVALQVLVKLLAGETVVAFLVGEIGFDFAFVLGTVVVAAVCVLCFVLRWVLVRIIETTSEIIEITRLQQCHKQTKNALRGRHTGTTHES